MKLRKRSKGSRDEQKKCELLCSGLKTQPHTCRMKENRLYTLHRKRVQGLVVGMTICHNLNVVERKIIQIKGGHDLSLSRA